MRQELLTLRELLRSYEAGTSYSSWAIKILYETGTSYSLWAIKILYEAGTSYSLWAIKIYMRQELLTLREL